MFHSSVLNNVDSYVCATSHLDDFSPWIQDPSATNYMTLHKHLLHNIQPLPIPYLMGKK